ncbi:MAG: phosphatase PAP2 family protein [Marmoricola sp.]
MDPHHPGAFLRLQERLFGGVADVSRHTAWLHGFFSVYAKDGVVLFALLLLGGWWIARSRGDVTGTARALSAPVGMLVAIGLNQPLGHLVAEPRPYVALRHVTVLVGRTSDFAFPSDHAVMAGAVAAGVLLVDRRLGVLASVLAVLMAFARVYVGAHYPLDVVAGLALGALVVVAGYAALRRPLERAVAALSGTRLRPLLTTAE